MEHAKAIGLDQDYLKRLEEQKRRREEIVRMKEQRRYGDAVRRFYLSTLNTTLNPVERKMNFNTVLIYPLMNAILF